MVYQVAMVEMVFQVAVVVHQMLLVQEQIQVATAVVV